MSHEQKSVLHDKVGLLEELAQFAELIGLFGDLSQREPRATILLSDSWVLVEVGLDDLFDLVDPSLLQVVTDLAGRAVLDLVELVHAHGLSDVRVEDLLCEHIVALLSDVLLRTDCLVLVQNGIEEEVVERLREVVGRDLDHALLRCSLLGFGLGQSQRT